MIWSKHLCKEISGSKNSTSKPMLHPPPEKGDSRLETNHASIKQMAKLPLILIGAGIEPNRKRIRSDLIHMVVNLQVTPFTLMSLWILSVNLF